MRVVCVADTRERHRDLVIPPGDLLIHAGDFTLHSRRKSVIADFNTWLGSLPHRHKIIIFGNHEFLFEAEPGRCSDLFNAVVHVNEAVEIAGFKLWGSPVTTLYGGAFGMSRAEDRRNLYTSVPEGTDILITHGPPQGILDGGQGCSELREATLRVRPKLHVFGHAHSGYGALRRGGTTYANAALAGEEGGLAAGRAPIVIDL